MCEIGHVCCRQAGLRHLPADSETGPAAEGSQESQVRWVWAWGGTCHAAGPEGTGVERPWLSRLRGPLGLARGGMWGFLGRQRGGAAP